MRNRRLCAAAGGGFVTIINHGATDDRLIGATSAKSGVVEIHQMSMEDDIMRMSPVADGLVIPAGETVLSALPYSLE